MMKTPVAFLIFNRPDTTAKVFEAIRQAKPPKLLVVADSPRTDKPGEVEKCKDTREIIKQVDWECEVLTNYSDVNLGCKKRVASGLDWVFENVEEAIILEDDCLPHLTFFRFCEELLEHYRYDNRVMHISGCNYGISGSFPDQSYYFSTVTGIWGWASWRRAWKFYDVNISYWDDVVKQSSLFKDIFCCEQEFKLRSKNWQRVHSGEIDTWDYSWHLSCVCQGGLSIKPTKNLVTNIGFGPDATHTKVEWSPLANLSTEEMQFPLQHPKFILKDTNADIIYFNKMLKSRPLARIDSGLRKIQFIIENKLRFNNHESSSSKHC